MIANNDALTVDENSQNNNINVLANDVAEGSVLTFESLLDISFPSAIPAGVSDAIDFSLESLDDTFSGTVTDNGIAWQYQGSIDINYTTYELSISIQVTSDNGYSGEMVGSYNTTTETFSSTINDNAGTSLTLSSTETDSTYTETINGTVNSYNFNNFSYTEDTSNNTYTVNGGSVTDANGNTINVGTADLSVSSASAANGTVVINSDSTLNYTPNTDFYGTDTITYLSTDGSSTDTATVTVTINESHAIDNTVVTAADFNGATATFAGDIESGGNKDQYEFDAVAGHTYTFDAISNGTLGDNYLTLYDANGTLVTSNDDGGPGYDAQITWTPTASGTYTVEVRAYSSSATGTYEMQINVQAPHINAVDNTVVTATDFNGDTATFSGDIEANGNVDQYVIDAVAGYSYNFEAVNNGTLSYNSLYVYDANGALVAGTSYETSGVAWTPTTSGTYTVEVGGYSGSYAGTYEMQINVDDHQSHINSDTIIFNSHVNNIPATGFNVLLVLDKSGSMGSGMTDMQLAVNNMLSIYEAVGLDTNIHVAYFDSSVYSTQNQLFATNDFSGAATFINNFYAGGGTNYVDAAGAAQAALEAFSTDAASNTNHMFFISDGEPNDPNGSWQDFRSTISTLGIEVSMFGLGFSGANTTSLDYFDNTNGSEVIATVEGLSQILLEELGTSQGSVFFSAETLLANDTGITNASVTNVSITSAEGSLVDLGNGYFQYTPSSDEKYGTADHPTFTYTVNYDDINGNNTTTQTFVIQTSLVQAINQGTDGDDTMLFSPGLYDAIDGGTGDDTLIANEAFNNYVVGSLHDNVIMQDADAYTSFITSMENFTFSDQSFTAAELAANNDVRPLFSTSESLVSGQWSNGFILPDLFSSGDAALDALYDYQFIGDSSGEILGTSSANDFINSNAGDDAVNAGAGNDIIDGGLGSNFLTGGTGNDVFFSDGRGAANGDTTWSTITDFTSGGNMVNIWGYVDGASSYAWYADQGAAGYTGATIHADIDGDGLIDTSMTFSGMDIADMSTPQALDIAGTGYLFVA